MLYALVAIMGLGLVDSYFISYLGTEQLAAIGFIVPIVSIITSFGLGLGMAISSLTSKLIGSGNLDSAARLITDGFYLTGIVALISTLMLVWQMENIFVLLGAQANTLDYIHQYMSTWMFAAPLSVYSMVCASTFRALGDTATSARIAISMTLTNAVLDPLLIFGIGPFPELGMQGAALATVLAVVLAISIGFYQLGIKEKFLLWSIPHWQDFKYNLNRLLHIAIPALLANAIIPATSAVLTTLVAKFGIDAVAGYGVGTRVEQLSLMIVFALSSTLPMFIGQNLGANKLERVQQSISLAFRFVIALQLLVFLVLIVSADTIAKLFSSEQSVQDTIVTFLWIVPLSYGLSGVVVLINVAVNVLGKPRLALYINSCKLLAFYLPLTYFGAKWFELKGLFIGIAIGNCLSYVLALVLLNKTLIELKIKPSV